VLTIKVRIAEKGRLCSLLACRGEKGVASPDGWQGGGGGFVS